MLLARRPLPRHARSSYPPVSVALGHPLYIQPSVLHDHDLNAFVAEVERDFRKSLQTPQLLHVSAKLQVQFREKLGNSDSSMLPSYTGSLPTGRETGEFLVADLGGSAFRLAWIRLEGCNGCASPILRRWDFPISELVRSLSGTAFFDWMASKITMVLADVRKPDFGIRPLSLGLAWSFPLEHGRWHESSDNDTDRASHKPQQAARLLQMGKAFRAADGLIGQDLRKLVQDACGKLGVNLKVSAIVNDGAAGLLSQTYANQSTSMAVILGTGLNVAINLPIGAVNGKEKSTVLSQLVTNVRPTTLVNTELSMFGANAYTLTPWDHILKMMHPNPDFQPLEHLTSGRYLGEIVRLILVKAIQDRSTGLFSSNIPTRFGPYELETSTLATIEADTSPSLSRAAAKMDLLHPLPGGARYTARDIALVRRITICVTDRAAAYLATAIHALTGLEKSLEPSFRTRSGSKFSSQPHHTTSVGCLGSVLTKYPLFRERVQEWLDRLGSDGDGAINLVTTDESEGALLGAAVAVAVALGTKDEPDQV